MGLIISRIPALVAHMRHHDLASTMGNCRLRNSSAFTAWAVRRCDCLAIEKSGAARDVMRTETRTQERFLQDIRRRWWIPQFIACGEYRRAPEAPPSVPKLKLEVRFPAIWSNASAMREQCATAFGSSDA